MTPKGSSLPGGHLPTLLPCITERCAAPCCDLHEVPLLDADVERIASYTGKAPADFVDADQGWLLLKGAGVEETGCVFRGTVEPDGSPQVGCTIHTARPAACRTYPFVWRMDETAQPFVDRDASCPHAAAFVAPPEMPRRLEALWQTLNEQREARLA